MMESELEMRKLGIPVKTRHNEVAPAQYEIAPMFENSNVGSDHQQLLMQVLENVARRYGLVCLLHEKPFAGVNGSGKHNNWSMGTDTGSNLLDPGDTPADNIHFLFFCAAVIQAVNKHQGLLRASVANIGQDHRLGANEAPPAIISIFLGAELEKVFEAIASGEGDPNTPASFLDLGATVLPPLPMDGGDRNRTSPFAFTGNKFEFRALGSSMSLAFPNTVLNTIAAEAIDELAGKLEEKTRGGTDAAEAVIEIVKESYLANKQVCFSGDNYSEEWHAEAEQRGLKNLQHHARRAARGARRPDRRRLRELQRALQARARVPLRGLGRAVLDPRQHRGGDRLLDRQDDAAAGGAAPPGADRRGRRLRARGRGPRAGRRAGRGARRARGGQRLPDELEGLDLAIHARDKQLAAMARSARRPTSWRRSSPTTSGRCRSTRRCSSSSRGASAPVASAAGVAVVVLAPVAVLDPHAAHLAATFLRLWPSAAFAALRSALPAAGSRRQSAVRARLGAAAGVSRATPALGHRSRLRPGPPCRRERSCRAGRIADVARLVDGADRDVALVEGSV